MPPKKKKEKDPLKSPLLTKPKDNDYINRVIMSRDFCDKFINKKSSNLLKAVDNLIAQDQLSLYTKETSGIDSHRGIVCKLQSVSNQVPYILDLLTNTSDIFSIMLENADNVCWAAVVKKLPHPFYYCATYDPNTSDKDTDVVGFKFELNRIRDKFGLMNTGYEKLKKSYDDADLKLSNFKNFSDRTNGMSKLYIAYAMWDPVKKNMGRFNLNYEKDENNINTQMIESIGFKVNYKINTAIDPIPEGQFTYDSLLEWGRESLASIERVTEKVSENQFLRRGKLLPLLNVMKDPSKNPLLEDTNATGAQNENTLRVLLLEDKYPKPTKPKTFTVKELTDGLENLRTEIMQFDSTPIDSFSDFMSELTVNHFLRQHFGIEVDDADTTEETDIVDADTTEETDIVAGHHTGGAGSVTNTGGDAGVVAVLPPNPPGDGIVSALSRASASSSSTPTVNTDESTATTTTETATTTPTMTGAAAATDESTADAGTTNASNAAAATDKSTATVNTDESTATTTTEH